MQQVDTNVWSLQLPFETSDFGKNISMKNLVNDEDWAIGANFMLIVPNKTAQVDYFPFFYSTTGSYEVLPPVYSTTLNNSRNLIVYTPPSYYENTEKVITNVIVMHDGENLFNDSTSFGGIAWHCQDTIDLLVNEGQMDEVVILGVYNTLNRINEYTYSYDANCSCPYGAGGDGDLYLDFLEKEVMPMVKSKYRISYDSSPTGMIGSSLGGLISCYAGWTRPNVWGKVGCMSSSFWWNNQDFNTTILTNNAVPPNLIVYVDSGNAGPGKDDMKETQTVRNHLESLGFILDEDLFYYLQDGGMHNEYYWGKRFHVPMRYLYPPSTIVIG